MPSLDPRLVRLFDTVRPTARLSIIVTTSRAGLEADLRGAGMSVRGSSGAAVYGTASHAAAERIAELDGVVGVFYDEPIHAVGRG